MAVQHRLGQLRGELEQARRELQVAELAYGAGSVVEDARVRAMEAEAEYHHALSDRGARMDGDDPTAAAQALKALHEQRWLSRQDELRQEAEQDARTARSLQEQRQRLYSQEQGIQGPGYEISR